MNDLQNDQGMGSGILNEVHEGMAVVDGDGDEIGTVEFVYLGAVGESTTDQATGAATTGEVGSEIGDTFIGHLAGALAYDEELPEAVRDRLMRQGYARVDAGLLRTARFVMPEHIASVADDTVRLHVTLDELPAR